MKKGNGSESQRKPGVPTVGIGASAGGLAAFEAFFSTMPASADPGMAFVLVQHLAPDYKSMLSELIRRYTRMQVFEIEDGMEVQPNCVYVIPPGRDAALLNGKLQLLNASARRGMRLPIDSFFRSLAEDQHERAIGIVLSGTGSDGTLGVRAIKSEGGMVMAQSPASCEFDGMPRSAIATGLVDYELAPDEMPERLAAYVSHAFGKPSGSAIVPAFDTENALKKIFALLHAQTGRDFSDYKPNTVHRRIERRMALHQIEKVDAYATYLQQTPTEAKALLRDLLIGVTSFFRDPDAFRVLEEQGIPRLFADKPAGDVVRVWSAGCSTGEEAYSIAILLRERMEALQQSYTLQVFATDVDDRAIATARAGLYPASIAADVSPERLARFFTEEPDGSGYRIRKVIREMMIFSEQDVISDPPFSRLDMISCRNLLIYLGTDLQKKLIPLFHYALKPDGILFLGTSESVGEFTDLFATLDLKSKLYQRRQGIPGTRRAPLARSFRPLTTLDAELPRGGARRTLPAKLPLKDLTEQALLAQVVSAGALVDGQGDILYLHGRTGMYLEPAPGEAGINNILRMAREGLRPGLSMNLQKAVSTKGIVRCPGLLVKSNGHFRPVNLTICPVTVGASDTLPPTLYVVVFEEAPPLGPEGVQAAAGPAGEAANDAGSEAGARIAALEQELRARDAYLRVVQEELERSNQDLKSVNEEMQSGNEELQSTNEELETSMEELQSVNEEMTTVNVELQSKVADLARANHDMTNLLAGTDIGTVFVDHALCILRFTPAATSVINLIPSDVGRPLGHLVSNLVGYDGMVADVHAVLDTLVPRKVEVQTAAGNWYSMRIQPYRGIDNVIEGAVIYFMDITETVRIREALRAASELSGLALAIRDARDAIVVQHLDGRVLAWNRAAAKAYGWSEFEALAMKATDRIPGEICEPALAQMYELSRSEILEPCHTRRLTKAGSVVDVTMVATALLDEAGQLYAIATTERVGTSPAGSATEVASGRQAKSPR